MQYIKQFCVILGFSFLGELCNSLLPLPVPASIYGMVFLLFALGMHWVKLDAVEKTSDFLIEIMPIMFIPAGVGLLESYEQLRPILLPVLFITVITTFFVMVVTGKISQIILEWEEKKKDGITK